MARIKDWLMGMEEDAIQIDYYRFVKKHGAENENIWLRLNNLGANNYFDFYNDDVHTNADVEIPSN